MFNLSAGAFDLNLDAILEERSYTEGLEDYLDGIDSNISDKNMDRLRDAEDVTGSINDTFSRVAPENIVSKDGYQPSIVARARNSVLQFPVYVTQGIRVDEAHVISKLFERVYTTLVQTVIAQHPVLDQEEANNLVFLKKFHTNLKESATVAINKYYEAIDDLDQMMQDSLFYSERLSENCTVEFHLGVPDPELIKENARLLNEPLTGFIFLKESITSTSSGNNTTNSGTETKTIKDIPERVLTEKDFKKLAKQNDYDDIFKLKEDMADGVIQLSLDGRAIRSRKVGDNIEFYCPATKETSTTSSQSTTVNNTGSKTVKQIDDVKVPVILKEADVKKINGMLPYTMEVQFHLKNGNATTNLVRYVLGIKTVLHLISIKDLSDDLAEIINGDMKSLRKVRYKSGEISFKDYLFDVSNAKKAALNSINGNKKWLNTLRRLGDYRKLQGTVFSKNAVTGTAQKAIGPNTFPIPNGTMILSQPEVIKLMNDTGIDLSTVANAKRLANALFLIAVVIIDSTAGTMRVLFTDSDTNWDIQSLASVQSEVNKVDNKKLANEISHMINR